MESNEKILKLEAELQKKESELAKLKAYLDGYTDGYFVARGEVVDMLKLLPELSSQTDIDSLSRFFIALAKLVNNVSVMTPPLTESNIIK